MKYRQPGYKDSDRDNDRARQRDRPQGPRGERPPREITTREAATVWRCADCGHQVAVPDSVETSALCPSCSKPLHTCRNCLHFDTSARFECRQAIPAPVRSKIQANDCTLFAPAAVLDATGRRLSTPGGARAAFDALFRKK